MTQELFLPVSIGEGLDKLTILDIKMDKIKDDRRADCQKEYAALFEKLETYVKTFPWHYAILKDINLHLWNLQDEFHGKDVDEITLGKICSKVLLENDRRFRMKSKINHVVGSSFREQKGYAIKRAFLYGHLGLGDMFWLNGAVRYLATCYDEVVVACKEHNIKNADMMYSDDPRIVLYPVKDDYQLYPWHQMKRKMIEAEGFTVYACGFHAQEPAVLPFPQKFYDQLGLNREIRTQYFHIPTFPESNALLEEVQAANKEFGIVHQKSSVKTLEIWKTAHERNPGLLLLDINENHYEPSHPFYSIANKIVGQPLLHYKRLLEEATEIHLLESSLYCLASHLDLSRVKAKICYDAFDHSNERIGVFATGTLSGAIA